MDNGQKNNEIGGLENAISLAMKKPTDKEKILAVLDCVRGYKNDFSMTDQQYQYSGYNTCKEAFKRQIDKIKQYVEKNS